MPCPSYASTSNVKLYWSIDAAPKSAIATDANWVGVRMTGESFDLNLSSTVSDEITAARSYSNSVITQGEVTGGFNFELSDTSYDEFIIAALQSSTAPASWTNGVAIQNGEAQTCFMFMKQVVVSGTTYYFLYRGCQVDTMTLSIQPNALITGSFTFQGVGGEVVDTIAGWTGSITEADTTIPVMSGVYNVSSLGLDDSIGNPIATTFQGIDVTLSNQLRQQQAVGTGDFYAAGVASGRFQATLSSTQYFGNHSVYDEFIADSFVTLAFYTLDSNGDGYQWQFPFMKIQSGTVPMAGGPDQDMTIAPAFQAFESAANGTVNVTRVIV